MRTWPEAMQVVVFGGSFDPVHLGHVAIADRAKEWLCPDRFLWVPAFLSPCKKEEPLGLAEARVSLLEKVVQIRDGEEVHLGEISRGGRSWTVETLRELAGSLPGADFTLLLGADCLDELEKWKEAEEVFFRARFVICSRAGRGEEALEALKVRLSESMRAALRVDFLAMEEIPISSTEVRRKIRNGKSLADQVPGNVEEEILRLGLYRT